MRVIPFTALSLLVWCFQASAAEVWGRSFYAPEPHADKRVGEVFLIGDIVEGDTEKLVATVKDGNAKGILTIGVNLLSAGGDLSEGLLLGQTIRGYRLLVRAPDDAPPKADCKWLADGGGRTAETPVSWLSEDCLCTSACALAWMGGIGREGTVGFHHMSLAQNEESLTFDQLENSLSSGRNSVRDFLRNMRAPDWVFSKVLETPSNMMEYFDAEDTGLTFDPIFSEFILAKCGLEPPDEASTYKRKLENEKASNKLSKGGEYALSLITEKIDGYWACVTGSVVQEIEKRQEINVTYDKSRWSADVVKLNYFDIFDDLIPSADGSTFHSGRYDWWKKELVPDIGNVDLP